MSYEMSKKLSWKATKFHVGNIIRHFLRNINIDHDSHLKLLGKNTNKVIHVYVINK